MAITTARRATYLLFVLLALFVAVRPAATQGQGFHFRTEAAYAEFSFADPNTGIVTNISVYAADDQGYKAKGDTGAPERISKIDVVVEQYDPNCEGGGKGVQAQAGGGGDPECFYRSLTGTFPEKGSPTGLPEDAFVVSGHQLDGARLSWTLTLVEFVPDGEPKLHEATVALNWTAAGPIERSTENETVHQPYPGQTTGTFTIHRNTQKRAAVATGTISFDGAVYDLTSGFAQITDFQETWT